jgi:anti-sigma B factor antagonist
MVRGETPPRGDSLRRTEPAPPVDLYRSDGADLSDFDVVTVYGDGEVVVAVRGEVDLATAPRLWEHLEEAIPDATDRLIVDLAETTFIDSTALAVFIRAFKRLRHADGDLVLRAPSKTARKVFAITGLDLVMTIEG